MTPDHPDHRSYSDWTTGHEGFSLLDVLISIVVATIAVVGVGAVFVSSQRSHESALEEAVLTHAFRRTVEQVRGEDFQDVANLYQDYAFSVDEVNGSGTLTLYLDETASVPELGLPRDLDGDGAASSKNVAAGYTLLPLRIDISWNDQTRTLYTFLSEEG